MRDRLSCVFGYRMVQIWGGAVIQPLLSYVRPLKKEVSGEGPHLVMEESLFDWFSGDNCSSVATGSSIVILYLVLGRFCTKPYQNYGSWNERVIFTCLYSFVL